MQLHPPPEYKLKIENQDQHDALVFLCELNAFGALGTFDLLCRHIRFLVLAKEVKGKATYSVTLRAHEAIELCNIIGHTNSSLKGKLSEYNATLYQDWANSIHKATTEYYLTKINA
jgi:hypothetical protein